MSRVRIPSFALFLRPTLTFLQALLLGIVQGLTEFFPVSSSGHLTLIQSFFGLEQLENYIVFDLVCHLGTLCSIFVVYSKKIRGLFSGQSDIAGKIAVATLPLFPIVLFIKPIESLFDRPDLIGFFLICTSLILYTGIRWGYDAEKTPSLRDALWIGLAQAVAILPGISRSGATLSSARLLGWKKEEALSFSFLMAIPAILGGIVLKTIQILFQSGSQTVQGTFLHHFIGFLSAFISGCFALLFLIRLVSKEKLMYFVAYCLLLGTGSSLYFLIRS